MGAGNRAPKTRTFSFVSRRGCSAAAARSPKPFAALAAERERAGAQAERRSERPKRGKLFSFSVQRVHTCICGRVSMQCFNAVAVINVLCIKHDELSFHLVTITDTISTGALARPPVFGGAESFRFKDFSPPLRAPGARTHLMHRRKFASFCNRSQSRVELLRVKLAGMGAALRRRTSAQREINSLQQRNYKMKRSRSDTAHNEKCSE